MRTLYGILKWVQIIKSAKRGVGPLIRQRLRAKILKHVARFLRRILKP